MILGTASALAGLLLCAACFSGEPPQPSAAPVAASRGRGEKEEAPPPDLECVTIAGEVFHLELALTPAQHARGLMGRPDVPGDGGMLFVSAAAELRTFWMAYTLVDLDIIFLDSKGCVNAMHRMKAEPPRKPGESETDYFQRLPRYCSGRPAQFVIELQGGTLDRLNLAVGDRVGLDLSRLTP
jgi:uncharacterized membrane protein (UPF0127 family)